MKDHRLLRRSAPALALLAAGAAFAWDASRQDPFGQLHELLPTPNTYRTASGAPGHAYWQQQVDYSIRVTLDEEEQRVTGSETITYHNRSPDTLAYLWLQLDPNLFAPRSHAVTSSLAPSDMTSQSFRGVERLLARDEFDGSMSIAAVTDGAQRPLAHTVVGTLMRVDLPQPLAPGATTRLAIDWTYRINDAKLLSGRTGYELFEDGNRIYEIAQWFPRLAAYTDVNGWQNKQYLGGGEFTLEFGDYEVAITVPDDHVVAATGVLQNPDEVLLPVWRERLREAAAGDAPRFIVTPDEARANHGSRPAGTKTWVFAAENVRDFAFASSRKFAWDALLARVAERDVWCMSYYPVEGEPLWSRYSTRAIAHTLEVYSRHAFPYPYPVAISVNGPVGGMEYPMICFNGPRPEPDGTYSKRTKYGLISVVIHEVGHNFFPMVVNSDERQWTWMDEGLNTFLQYLAEQAWEERYPSRRGEPQDIAEYMASAGQVPIMTNSESLLQFSSNAYAKPATALNILRETVLGRELFDFAFREYANRWRFKRPEPADLFRTLEDASAVDLDWFFRGWFFTTDHTDLAIEDIELYRIDSQDPHTEQALARAAREAEPETLAEQRNRALEKRLAAHPELADFYNSYDDLEVSVKDVERYEKLVAGLDERQRALLASPLCFYVVRLANEGGLVMPVILEVGYADGSSEELRLPAELWRKDSTSAAKLVISAREITSLVLDPHLETADTDLSDNFWPRRIEEQRIRLRADEPRGKNPMQEAHEAEQATREAAATEAAGEPAAGSSGGAPGEAPARSAGSGPGR